MQYTDDQKHRAILRRIARGAMLERGLVPDFPPRALAELDAIRGPAPQGLGTVSGLDGNLRLQERAARLLKALRHQHGALELETIEARSAAPVFRGMHRAAPRI